MYNLASRKLYLSEVFYSYTFKINPWKNGEKILYVSCLSPSFLLSHALPQCCACSRLLRWADESLGLMGLCSFISREPSHHYWVESLCGLGCSGNRSWIKWYHIVLAGDLPRLAAAPKFSHAFNGLVVIVSSQSALQAGGYICISDIISHSCHDSKLKLKWRHLLDGDELLVCHRHIHAVVIHTQSICDGLSFCFLQQRKWVGGTVEPIPLRLVFVWAVSCLTKWCFVKQLFMIYIFCVHDLVSFDIISLMVKRTLGTVKCLKSILHWDNVDKLAYRDS